MIIPVKTKQGEYNIVLKNGALHSLGEHMQLDRKVFIVTDSGVPKEYSTAVACQCKEAAVITIRQGEESKNFETYRFLLEKMVENNMTRSDCVVAVGGGVVGDMAGFAAASYMRGIDFYNIPTTVLSQVDSSIGGKTAIDFCGLKNIVGAFHQPKAVVIDPATLSTLPQHHVMNGLAEAIKMAATSDAELFGLFEQGWGNYSLEEALARALMIKKKIVEQDENESGIRKILNFGHTLAHAIESNCDLKDLLHGECVAIGMLPMCSKDAAIRIKKVLENHSLPISYIGNVEDILVASSHDKKMSGSHITLVFVDQIGKCELKEIPFSEYEDMMRREFSK